MSKPQNPLVHIMLKTNLLRVAVGSALFFPVPTPMKKTIYLQCNSLKVGENLAKSKRIKSKPLSVQNTLGKVELKKYHSKAKSIDRWEKRLRILLQV
jgi:hypothetical protein